MQVYKGTIISCDDADSVHDYLVEEGGRIVHVGDELPDAYRGAPVTELGQRALLPSFGDGHLHFSSWALVAGEFFDTRTARDLAELGEIIRANVKRGAKNKILAAFGTSKHSVTEQRLPTREELDAFYSDKPLYIICYDGHSSIGNSKLIDLLPDTVKEMRGFHADSGLLLHEAYYGATDFVSGTVPPLALVRSIIGGYNRLASAGIGLIHATEGIGFPRDLDVTMVSHIARATARRSAFQTRLFFQTMAVDKVLKRKLPRIGGCFATALDGCFGVCDAALNEPYSHQPDNKGILFFSDEEVVSFTKRAHRAGLQISLHAIGDAAVDQAVMALGEAQKDFPREDARHILIHACLLSEQTLDRCAELGIGITLQPAFLISPLEPISYLEQILGPRATVGSPLRSIVDRGVHLSGGSDAPVTHPDPIEGIYGACNHPYDPAQSLTIPEALKMYTREVAWGTFDEKERGTLERGKIADMVVLNQNPLDLEPVDLRRLEPEQLLLGGQPYTPGKGVWSALTGGLLGRGEAI
jgi:predicted amidohydrolase YtcJ